MPRISENQIQEIRQNVNIVDIIKSYIPLTPKGKNFFGVCPFHQDHTPSMSVSEEKQIFKCFTCGAHGNVFQFVKDFLNISFIEAVSIVAEKSGQTFIMPSIKPKKVVHQKEYEIMELTSIFFQNNLNTKEGLEAKKYLQERNLSPDIIKMFNIGLATSENSLLNLLEKKEYLPSQLEQLGLVKKNGIQYYDIFQKRIMFPIENPDGQVVGFTGRVFTLDGTPKYLNSKETILFKKGNILYNYHRAKEQVRLSKKIILVEGNMDAIRMSACGFINTIALMGTSLTKEQIELIRKLRVPLTLMLDNDEAGKINTYQNGLLLEKEGIPIDVVRLENAKDPDEYLLKFGKESMEQALNHPISFIEFKLIYLKENKNLKDTKDLVAYVKEVIKSISDNDDLTKEITIKKLSQEYDISYDILKSELNIKEEKENKKEKPKIKEKNKSSKYDLCVKAILFYMMNDASYIKMYQNRIGNFKEKKYRQIANEIVYYYEKNKYISLADFLSYAELSPIKDDILEIDKEVTIDNLRSKDLEEYLLMLKSITLEDQLKKLKEEQQKSLDINVKMDIGLKITEICKEREELIKERSVNNDKI